MTMDKSQGSQINSWGDHRDLSTQFKHITKKKKSKKSNTGS